MKSRRKTYTKKSTAKNARKKGYTTRKVKGGYRNYRTGHANVTLLLSMILMTGLFAGCATLTGCDESDYQAMDQAAETTGTLTDAAESVMNGPAGVLIPPFIKTPTALILGGLGALAAYWKDRRRKVDIKDLKSNVKSQESRAEENEKTAKELKYAIKIFEDTGPEGNDQMKAAKAAALNPDTVDRLEYL